MSRFDNSYLAESVGYNNGHANGMADGVAVGPDGHPKLLHFWPVKLLQAGRSDYDDSCVMAMRAAASLSR